MEDKILVCDIGNTAFKIGIASKTGILTTYALPVNRFETIDSLGLMILMLLAHAGQQTGFRACVVCSVVPSMDALIGGVAEKYLHCPVLFVPGDLAIPLENRYERPEEVGADRLVGAYAARMLYPEPASIIVVDFGTAVTFDCINSDVYLGGLIFPGPYTAMASLARNTAKLPTVNMHAEASNPIPGRNTATSIQHGMVFGYQCMTDGLCEKLKCQLPAPVMVVGTGGFADAIGRLGSTFDAIRPNLLLAGLRMLFFEDCL